MNASTLGLLAGGLLLLVVGAELLVRGAAQLAAALRIPPLLIGLTIVAYGTSAPELAVSVAAAWSGQSDLALGNVVGSNIFNVLFILGAAAAITPLIVSARIVRFDVPVMIGVALLVPLLGFGGRISQAGGGLLLVCGVVYTALVFALGQRAGAPGESAPPAAGAPASSVANALLALAGLALLVLGSRWLVAGATGVARGLGVSELLIGLTIVAAGTSLPEVATSLVAAVRGQRDIAVGNVVGSNIFNVLFVLGAAACTAPGGVGVSAEALRFDVPVMIAVSVACLPIFFSGHRINRWEGLLLLGYYVAYTAYLVLAATRSDGLASFNAAMAWFVLPLTGVTLVVIAWRQVRRAPQ